MNDQVYIFSGLGADERVFQKIDFSGYSPKFIEWVSPLERESIEDYATRLLRQISSPNPTLIGLSFGGIMAIEVAKQIETKRVILLASVKTKSEIPFYFRFAGLLRLHKLLPIGIMKRPNFLTYWLFGTKTAADRNILRQILADTDPVFLKWAIDRLLRWSNTSEVRNLTHIHGTNDKLLPIMFVRADIKISRGGHFMTLANSAELTSLLRNLLEGNGKST